MLNDQTFTLGKRSNHQRDDTFAGSNLEVRVKPQLSVLRERSSEIIPVIPVKPVAVRMVANVNDESNCSKYDFSSSGSGAKAYRYDRKDKS